MKKRLSIKGFYILMSSVFGGIGIIFLIFSIAFLIQGTYIKENYYLTNGLVVDVIKNGDSGDIYVSYFHNENGNIYHSEYELINYYSSNIDEGDILDIYINPQNGEIEYVDFLISYIFNGIALVFIIVSLVFLIIVIKYQNKKKKYMKYGAKIYAKVVNYSVVKNINYGYDEHPYKIRCEHEDIFGKKTYFISEPVFIKEHQFRYDKYIAVYLLDKKDLTKYYVDVNDIKEQSQIIVY